MPKRLRVTAPLGSGGPDGRYAVRRRKLAPVERLPPELLEEIVSQLVTSFSEEVSVEPDGEPFSATEDYEIFQRQRGIFCTRSAETELMHNLCQLRRVSKVFHAAATKALYDTGSLAFEPFVDLPRYERCLAFCDDPQNASVLSCIKHVRVDVSPRGAFGDPARRAPDWPMPLDDLRRLLSAIVDDLSSVETLCINLSAPKGAGRPTTDQLRSDGVDGALLYGCRNFFRSVTDISLSGPDVIIDRFLGSMLPRFKQQLKHLYVKKVSWRSVDSSPAAMNRFLQGCTRLESLGLVDVTRPGESLELNTAIPALKLLYASRITAPDILGLLRSTSRRDEAGHLSLESVWLRSMSFRDNDAVMPEIFAQLRDHGPRMRFFGFGPSVHDADNPLNIQAALLMKEIGERATTKSPEGSRHQRNDLLLMNGVCACMRKIIAGPAAPVIPGGDMGEAEEPEGEAAAAPEDDSEVEDDHMNGENDLAEEFDLELFLPNEPGDVDGGGDDTPYEPSGDSLGRLPDDSLGNPSSHGTSEGSNYDGEERNPTDVEADDDGHKTHYPSLSYASLDVGADRALFFSNVDDMDL